MASLRGFLWAALIGVAWCGAHADASSDAARVLAAPDRPAYAVLSEDRDDTSLAVIEARSGSYAAPSPRSVVTAYAAPVPTDSEEDEGRGAQPSRAPPFPIF